MVSLIEASRGRLVSADSDGAVYEGRFDDYWSIGGVPNGGYSLGTANACVQDYMTNHLKSTHTEAYHVSSTYLNAVEADKNWTLIVQIVKAGKNFSNLDGILSQKSNKTGKDTVRLQIRFIYTNMTRMRTDPDLHHLTSQPGSRFYPPFPVLSEPRDCTLNLFSKADVYKFKKSVQSFPDPKAVKYYNENNEISTSGYTYFNREEVSSKDVTWFNNVAIMLLVDVIWHSQEFIPKERKRDPVWYPTMMLNVEMKHPLPSFPLLRAAHYKTIRLVDHGQMDLNFEVWSHPEDAQKLNLPSGIKSILLCIARQAALTTPVSVQSAIVEKNRKKLENL